MTTDAGSGRTDAAAAVAGALAAAGPAAAGWTVAEVRPRDGGVLAVLAGPGGAPRVAVAWREHGGAPGRAYRAGPRYEASTHRGPGLVDVDAPGAPAEAGEVARRVAEALAALEQGPALGEAGEAAAGPAAAPLPPLPAAPDERGPAPADDAVEALAARLRLGLARDLGTAALPNPEGWEVEDVRVFRRWARVAEIRLRAPDRTLAFIVDRRDPARPAYARTASWDVTYYSDDLPVEEHAALYARDAATVERVAAWLRAVDPAGAP